jgi:hypothetical protein
MNTTLVRPAVAAAVLIAALAVALPELVADGGAEAEVPSPAAATTSASVHVLDERVYADGTAPYTRAATRTVPAAAPAGGALTALFAGPTPEESAAGLRFVGSGATGFRDLAISAGVARVHLVGGCAAGGSTFTVADLIAPTLKAFPTVTWVKIYGPDGSTERPTGDSDSIPECLEP